VLNFKNLIGPLCILFIYGVSIWSINKWELVTAGLFGIFIAIMIVKKNWVKNLF